MTRIDSESEELVAADDQIIGRALRNSILVLLVLSAVAAAAFLWFRSSQSIEVVEEAVPETAQHLDVVVEEAPPEMTFVDVSTASGLSFVHTSGAYGEKLLPETMGGGVAFLDYDNDGDQDLLFVDSQTWPWSDRRAGGSPVLYENDGKGQYVDVSQQTGLQQLKLYGMGVAVADIDGDGFRDLFVTAVGSNVLLKNEAGTRFVDITEQWGVAGNASDWSSGAAFFDADNDHDLDLFVANYVEWSREIDQQVDYRLTGVGRAYGPPTNYQGTHSRLYRHEGDRFVEVSEEAGIQVVNPATGAPAGKALAVQPVDVDEDGWMDLIVANDTVRNFYFRNQGQGMFAEEGMLAGLAFDNTGHATGAMGVDAATFADDQVAVAIGNFANEMTSLYVSPRRTALFSDQAVVSGVGPGSRQALSFGLFFFDADLDGRLDLLQTNGHVEDEINVVQPSQHYEQPTQMFWNCGSPCRRRFVQLSDDAVGDLATPVVGRGAAYADIDLDGDLDVVITQVGRRPLLLENAQDLGNSWVRVRIVGEGRNLDAIGARVTLRASSGVQERYVMPTRSYLSQVELPIVFGLPAEAQIESVEVTWPSGKTVVRKDVTPNQRLTISPPPSSNNQGT